MIRLKNKHIEAIFFDFDGVLVESAGIKTEAFYEMFKVFEQADEIMQYHKTHAGISRHVKFKHIYEKILGQRISEKQLRLLGDRFSDIVKKRVIAAPWVPGAEDLLQYLQGNCKCFVVSGTPETELCEIILARKAQMYFREVHGSPDTKTQIVGRLLQQYNLPPSVCLFVGDALADFEAAVANQIDFVARITDENTEIFKDMDVIKIHTMQELHSMMMERV